ncbi:RNA polymerase sigma factor SigV [Lachnospiraceae bacterium TWA4]|nr:RNA polymerase sigma factor SigV [Lachnospiraceae bacterium TWA4]
MKLFSGKNKNQTKEQLIEQILLDNYDNYFRLAYSYVHNEDDAGDIVQNGAYRAIKNCESLKQESYAATWIYRIMLNEIFRLCKDSKQTVISYEEVKEKEEQVGKEDNYINIDLQNALNTLDKRDRAIIILRFFEDKKIEEVADILGENVNTIKSRLYRSMRNLKRYCQTSIKKEVGFYYEKKFRKSV